MGFDPTACHKNKHVATILQVINNSIFFKFMATAQIVLDINYKISLKCNAYSLFSVFLT